MTLKSCECCERCQQANCAQVNERPLVGPFHVHRMPYSQGWYVYAKGSKLTVISSAYEARARQIRDALAALEWVEQNGDLLEELNASKGLRS